MSGRENMTPKSIWNSRVQHLQTLRDLVVLFFSIARRSADQIPVNTVSLHSSVIIPLAVCSRYTGGFSILISNQVPPRLWAFACPLLFNWKARPHPSFMRNPSFSSSSESRFQQLSKIAPSIFLLNPCFFHRGTHYNLNFQFSPFTCILLFFPTRTWCSWGQKFICFVHWHIPTIQNMPGISRHSVNIC